ncbi:AraC family transcriptional regulator [Rhodoferax sp. PAMC 29310]|uniref:AraC family transcriptional regulator n=1 Tax=Rhodoferax sp. PAMC 29310 TaxID=2822760 RepID=UPI001B326E3D|nr:AraC family transcriptional regulator [Rhodoferax sp. PAMC 29310]
MTSVARRLDRLSALLSGLAPRVEVARPQPLQPVLSWDAVAQPMLHLHLIMGGLFELGVEGGADLPVQGPAIVLCRGDMPHTLSASSVPAFEAMICARATLDGPAAALLLAEFAQPMVVSLAEADASLQQVIQLIAGELLDPRCGQPALLDRAGDILFIGMLRHLVAHPRTSRGLFNGLADPRIAATLVAMHTQPQQAWTLETLAHTAGMSRTAFATRFRELMNQPPGRYLGVLRLSIASRAVRAGLGLKRAARESGYASVSALSRALSRPTLDTFERMK